MQVTRLIGMLALGALAAGTASAQTPFFFDNFDTYTSQTEFEASWELAPAAAAGGVTPPSNFFLTGTITPTNPPGNTTSASPVSAPNFIGHNDLSATRNQKVIGETGNVSATNVVSFSFDFFDLDSAVAPFRQHSNLQNGPGLINGVGTGLATNDLVSMGLQNTQTLTASGGNFYMARILGYDPGLVADVDGGPAETVAGNGAFFKLNDFAASPLRSTGWHNLRVDISSDNGTSTDYDFYVDGILAEKVHNIGTSVKSYDLIRLGSGLTSTRVAFTDNMSVVLNPGGAPVPDNADFDGDDLVDGTDFLLFQRGVGIEDGSADPINGDANGDGNVDMDDYDVFVDQFGTPGGASVTAAAVPEPAACGLALLAIAGLAAIRRRS